MDRNEKIRHITDLLMAEDDGGDGIFAEAKRCVAERNKLMNLHTLVADQLNKISEKLLSAGIAPQPFADELREKSMAAIEKAMGVRILPRDLSLLPVIGRDRIPLEKQAEIIVHSSHPDVECRFDQDAMDPTNAEIGCCWKINVAHCGDNDDMLQQRKTGNRLTVEGFLALELHTRYITELISLADLGEGPPVLNFCGNRFATYFEVLYGQKYYKGIVFDR